MEKRMILRTIVLSIVYQVLFSIAESRDVPTFTRHSVKTIKGMYGDIYNCVDVYKQPALSHPFLKDHKIQMKPSSNLNFPSTASTTNHVVLEKIDCPERTIPIRRNYNHKGPQKMQNTTDTKYISKTQMQPDATGFGYDRAGIHIKPNPSSTFAGASAFIEIFNPKVEDDQFSAAVITVESDADNIQAGWMVNLDHYHDTQTRLTAFWELERVGCYTAECSLFVQTSNKYPLGAVISPVTQVGKLPRYFIPITLTLDSTVGAWWLAVYDTPIGYWPTKQYHNKLAQGAQEVFMGGEIYSGKKHSPPMGSGQTYKGGKYNTNCYMSHIKVRQEGPYVDPGAEGTTIHPRDAHCYAAGFPENKGSDEYVFGFGGPGGDVDLCQDLHHHPRRGVVNSTY